jgi:hypothetical protein
MYLLFIWRGTYRNDFDGGKSISSTIVLALFLFHWFALCNTSFRFQKTVQVSVNGWAGFNSLPVEKKYEFCLCEEELKQVTLTLT